MVTLRVSKNKMMVTLRASKNFSSFLGFKFFVVQALNIVLETQFRSLLMP